jgi:dolichol kinase
MLASLLSVGIIFMLLIFSEYLRRVKHMHAEISRKLVHVLVGSFIAFWPFYMSWQAIRVLAIALRVVIFLSRELHVFKAIHSVRRRAWGELLFPVSVLVASFLTQSKWVFAAAILHMSLADGFAALIGTNFGKKTAYKMFGQVKSLAGTLTFIVISFAITFWTIHAGNLLQTDIGLVVLWLPLTAALVENIGVFGIDNLFVPMLVLLVLNRLVV